MDSRKNIKKELENQPELLFFSDIKPDSSDWENNAIAKYFDLKEVIWKPRKQQDLGINESIREYIYIGVTVKVLTAT